MFKRDSEPDLMSHFLKDNGARSIPVYAFYTAELEPLFWFSGRHPKGEPFKKEAALAKLYSSTVAVDNARDATQIHGGYGFMNEYPVARMWRDSKILEIGEGTSEVQRMLIARELGLVS